MESAIVHCFYYDATLIVRGVLLLPLLSMYVNNVLRNSKENCLGFSMAILN